MFWNVPTFQCHKYGLNFSRVSAWGLEQNSRDEFRGEAIAILYDPGEFPALLKAPGGQSVPRNGGVPQEGSLSRHLSLFASHLDKLIPDTNFRGLGIIDFEQWRPVWRQNWGSLAIYRDFSRYVERRRHPFWFSSLIESEAKSKYEVAARSFMLETLRMAKRLRPRAKWGYYGYPFCFNYTPYNNRASCSYETTRDNDGMSWMFNEMSAHYPSLYLKENDMYSWKRRMFVEGRLNEAMRVAGDVPVYPYVWYKYHDTDAFLTQEDMVEVLRRPLSRGCRGVVIWGASNDVNTREKCQALARYLDEVIGPTVLEMKYGPRTDPYVEATTLISEGDDEDYDEDEDDDDDHERKLEKRIRNL